MWLLDFVRNLYLSLSSWCVVFGMYGYDVKGLFEFKEEVVDEEVGVVLWFDSEWLLCEWCLSFRSYG